MYIVETEITSTRIAEIFSSAFFDVSDITDVGFSVRGSAFLISVHVDVPRKTIAFSDISQLHHISTAEALIICNDLNRKTNLFRAWLLTVPDKVVIALDYQMTFEREVSPFHVVSVFRRFDRLATQAVHTVLQSYLAP